MDNAASKTGYLERFEHHLERAWHFAVMGETTLALYHRHEAMDNFKKVRGHALLARFDRKKIDAELNDLEKTAFAEGAHYYSNRARAFEKMGRPDWAADDMTKAADCGEKAGLESASRGLRYDRVGHFAIKRWFMYDR